MVLLIVIIAIGCLCGIGIDSFLGRKRKKNAASALQTEKKKHCGVPILGESRYHLCQSLPSDATPQKTEGDVKSNPTQDPTFVSADEPEGDPEPMDMDVEPLEIEPPEVDEEPNEQDEEITEIFGSDALLASGVSVDEMFQTNKVIEDVNATPKQELEAGRILCRNQKTDMFEQLASGSPKRLDRIRELMYMQEKKHNINEPTQTDPQGKIDFKDFKLKNLYGK